MPGGKVFKIRRIPYAHVKSRRTGLLFYIMNELIKELGQSLIDLILGLGCAAAVGAAILMISQ